MNVDRIKAWVGEGDEACYLAQVVHRIYSIFGKSLVRSDATPLMDILEAWPIEFDDGFVINDDSELWKMLGVPETSIILAILLDDPDPDALRWEYYQTRRSGDDFSRRQAALLENIRAFPGAKLRKYD